MDDTSPRGRGRPSTYSLEAVWAIADLFRAGHSLRGVIRAARALPRSADTVIEWAREHPEAAALWAIAKQYEAIQYAGDLTLADLEGHEVDPDYRAYIEKLDRLGAASLSILLARTDEERAAALDECREIAEAGLIPAIEGHASMLLHGAPEELARLVQRPEPISEDDLAYSRSQFHWWGVALGEERFREIRESAERFVASGALARAQERKRRRDRGEPEAET